MRGVRGLVATGTCLAVFAAADEKPRPWTEDEARRGLAAARSLIGTPYAFGGRSPGPSGGIDCLGVLFAALEAVSGCSWKSFSVSMTDAFNRSELGEFVPEFAPADASSASFELLRPGDLLFFAGPVNNRGEPAATKVDGVDIWVAHTGIYSGDGKFIVGDHYAGKAFEGDLRAYLAEYPYPYVFAVRPWATPKVKKCRAVNRPLAAKTSSALRGR